VASTARGGAGSRTDGAGAVTAGGVAAVADPELATRAGVVDGVGDGVGTVAGTGAAVRLGAAGGVSDDALGGLAAFALIPGLGVVPRDGLVEELDRLGRGVVDSGARD
jgi:hypothetical protein